MNYNVLDVPLDPLPEFMEDSTPQAVTGWIRDLPVFDSIPLIARLTLKGHGIIVECMITKKTVDIFELEFGFIEGLVTLYLSAMDEHSQRIWIEGYFKDESESLRVRQIIEMLANYMEYADRNRMYPFQVSMIGKKKKKGKEKKAAARGKEKATIVYLDRPPQGGRSESNAHKTREFGYPRRSHRRTLTHPRFKNHPKYKVYKGVRVKQTWCGPKEFQDRRRIYRLIEIQNEEYNP